MVPMTVPIIPAHGFLPMLGEVFFELIDDKGRAHRLHEVAAGGEYDLVITQKGGLARYRIGDRVRVTHFHHATPALELIGRSDAVCDLVGEKLNEAFVRDCIGAEAGFATLLPAGDRYVLLDRSSKPRPPTQVAAG